MFELTQRQQQILEFIQKQDQASNLDILAWLKKSGVEVSRVTVVRDLDKLLRAKLITQHGRGRNTHYQEAETNKLLKYIDTKGYFQKGPDERQVTYEKFNFDTFSKLKNIFKQDELLELKKLNQAYRARIKKLSSAALKKELERLTIELSWKSSKIEGNTYSLIDTEILIKEHQEARGHNKQEAIMIINHKTVFDYILGKKNNFKTLSLRNIENIHRLIIKGLHVGYGLRQRPVGITGTRYQPLDNQWQIRDALQQSIKIINSFKDPFSKSLVAMLLISYIQPFEDGNKRTARLLGDALLLAHNACPLSFRSVNESDYKKATLLFYEQNNARFFKELFIEQFKFAVNNYFLA